jgi:hypothetical protein
VFHNGKALNKFIKQYANERVTDLDVDELMAQLSKLTEIEEYSTSGATCSYFVEIDEGTNIYKVFCEGNLIHNSTMEDTPTNLLSGLCKSMNVDYKIIEKE